MKYPARNDSGTAEQAKPQLANLRARTRCLDSIFIGGPFPIHPPVASLRFYTKKSGRRNFNFLEDGRRFSDRLRLRFALSLADMIRRPPMRVDIGAAVERTSLARPW
jgi:hypothetical protein